MTPGELADWHLAPPVVIDDAGYGDTAEFRNGMTARGLAYVVPISGGLTAHADDAVPESSRTPDGGHRFSGVIEPRWPARRAGRSARSPGARSMQTAVRTRTATTWKETATEIS
jgi:hypothetical protein